MRGNDLIFYGQREQKAPCLNCTERSQTCHTTCEIYKEFKKKRTEEVDKIKERKTKENDTGRRRLSFAWMRERKRKG